MVSVVKFPEIPTLTIANDFQPYLVAPKQKKIDSLLSHILGVFGSEEYKTIKFVAKLISTAFSIQKNALPLDTPKEVFQSVKEASQITKTISGAFSVLGGISAVASLIKNNCFCPHFYRPFCDLNRSCDHLFRQCTSGGFNSSLCYWNHHYFKRIKKPSVNPVPIPNFLI